METKRLRTTLNDSIGSAKNTNDMSSFLSCIPLDVAKRIMKQQIESFDRNRLYKTYLTALPVDVVLPERIMQYCLSFHHGLTLRLVNKSFKLHYDANQRLLMKRLQQIAHQHSFVHDIEFDEHVNKTIVVDRDRSALTQTEINLGYQSLMQNIDDALNECIDGDKIMLHGVQNGCKWRTMNTSIQIIGVGTDASLTDVYNDDCRPNNPCGMRILGSTSIYFENVALDGKLCENHKNRFFFLRDDSKLYLKDCKLKFGDCAIFVADNAKLTAMSCEFDGRSSGTIAIEIDMTGASNVSLFGCTFSGCGHDRFESEKFVDFLGKASCVQICDRHMSSASNLTLECIANLFANNAGYPISACGIEEYEDGWDDEDKDVDYKFNADNIQCVLQNNIWFDHDKFKEANMVYARCGGRNS
eukprot:834426_1